MGETAKRTLHTLIGLALFALVALLPGPYLPPGASVALAALALMIYWWITRPVHIAVTALVPLLAVSLFSIVPMSSVLADYFSPIVVLLIGAGIIIACFTASGLDRRIALLALRVIGPSVRLQLVVWFVLSTLLSMFLPNAVVTATLCPIAAAMVRYSAGQGETAPAGKTLFLILLCIVWGAGLGGFGTPLGGAMNLVAIEHIEAYTGQEFMYITWTAKMLPYLLALSAGTLATLLLIRPGTRHLAGTRAFFAAEYKKLGRIRRAEVISLALFLVAVALAFTRPLYAALLPEFKPFYAFLLMGAAAFFLPGDSGRLIDWKTAVGQINWGLILLFSGGLAAGNLLVGTGAAQAIADSVNSAGGASLFVLALVFVVLGTLLSNASSNTAATAVMVPIVISIAAARAADPLPLVLLTAAACNCAFILPTSIRAIPVGYGLDVSFMLKKGMAAVAACFVILAAAALIVVL